MDALGIGTPLVTSCEQLAIKTPLLIQERAIPVILSGKDIVAVAPTGGGKTAAYALPILTDLYKDPYGIFAIVLLPTRELAVQVAEQFYALGSIIGCRVTTVLGGLDSIKQGRRWQGSPHVLVGTPGRIAAHLYTPEAEAGKRMRYLKYLVLDEADTLNEFPFAEPLARLMVHIPPPSEGRRTLLFSATLPESAQSELLAKVGLPPGGQSRSPLRLTVEYKEEPRSLLHYYVFCVKRHRAAFVYHILSTHLSNQKIIVFVGHCDTCELFRRTLEKLGLKAEGIHSLQHQRNRLRALDEFRSERCKILVATNLASRGLDIPMTDVIINLDLPYSDEDYIHRAGRAARIIGRKGRVISIVTEEDAHLVKKYEEAVGIELEKFPVEDSSVAPILNKVGEAQIDAKMGMEIDGFQEEVKEAGHRRKLLVAKAKTHGTKIKGMPRLMNRKRRVGTVSAKRSRGKG